MPARPKLRRTVRLFRAFRVEQADPDRFYRTLAEDSVAQLGRYAALAGATVLDVGGGPGYFAAAFAAARARYMAVEMDPAALTDPARPAGPAVLASGMALPVRDRAVDICYSSNVLEHVPQPWRMVDEMVRVTRPGGTIFFAFTTWWSPWGGHETSPWHYLGGRYARRRFHRRHGREPKNRYGETLFAVTVGETLRQLRHLDADVVALVPRYHPWWAQAVVRVPILRELLTWNLAVVLRRRSEDVRGMRHT